MNSNTNEEGVNRHVRAGVVMGLGITQIVLGGVCVLLGIILLVSGCEDDKARKHGNGVWSGLFYVLTGLCGIIAGRTRYNGFIVTFMVLNILSACLSLTTLGYGAADIDQSRDDTWTYFYTTTISCDKTAQSVSIACGALLIVLAIGEAVVAITSACFCCESSCCGQTYFGQVIQPASASVHYIEQTGYPGHVTTTTINYARPQVLINHQPGVHLAYGPSVMTTQITQPPPYGGAPPAYNPMYTY